MPRPQSAKADFVQLLPRIPFARLPWLDPSHPEGGSQMIEEGAEYDLVGHVLDQQIVDFIGRPMGMVDGLVLELRDDGPPRLSHIEIGGVTLGRRLGGRIGRLLEKAARRWGGTRGQPYRIPWERVKDVELDVELDVGADQTPAYYWEHRIGHLVRRIPGS
jgi:hypothetical protein